MRSSDSASSFPDIEGYTVHELIDTGGFSRVYRATQHGLERPVAIKVLNASFEDERQQRTFERECRLMGQLSNHPNIVTVFASGSTAGGRPAIVMELYAGTYRSDDQLPIAEVVDVGMKVAGALQTIHDGGVVHRDIKPHNIFLSLHGEPAIGDFGISSVENERTVTGGAGFSISYAPPEVFEDGGAGTAGDVYSLGATLYQLATGEVPFPHTGDPAEKTRSTVHKIISAPPPSIARTGAPHDLDRLLQRCMAKRIEDRPSSPAEVAEELHRIQGKVGRPAPRRDGRVPSRIPSSPDDGERTINRGAASLDQDPSGDQRSSEHLPRESTSSVTVVRDRSERREAGTETEPAPSTAPRSRRGLIVGAGAAVGVIVVSALAIAFAGGGSDSDGTATSTTIDATTTTTEFLVLSAPDDLIVTEGESGVYELAWTSVSDDVHFQVQHIGGSSRFADTTSLTWELDDGDPAPRFEVRSVDEERTRVSQSSAGPVCADG